ncbi:DUF3813 domain-containing protein [Ectobacillus polymachus]|uniref:DUF3813 domain-containing protein n=1 Tax=Ectobacillus polymachus TaxID=1508806 RepID=UPI003A85FD70
MGNMLFQQAREAVTRAVQSTDGQEQTMLLEQAKNALSSAYHHSSTAEKHQLRQLQQQLHEIEHIH